MSLRHCIEESPQQYGMKKSTFTGDRIPGESLFTALLVSTRNLHVSAQLAKERQHLK